MNPGVVHGLASAALFGVSTPLAKELVGSVPPLWIAALLYLGAGTGLFAVLVTRRVFGSGTSMALMYGLRSTSGASASLLLNLEAVLTALLAWFLFRENFDRRIAMGMLVIVAGAVLLGATEGGGNTSPMGPALVALACLCWALDNNLTRKASASDAVFLAALKGLVAGLANGALALAVGLEFPPLPSIAAVGFLGYGVSLVLFILALRHLGTARAGACFSVAPFFGAVLAALLGQDTVSWSLATAAGLMGFGVWLHVSERHVHEHRHELTEHSHLHGHDEHHRHEHEVPWNGEEPHVHVHVHPVLTHSHLHYPDVHHRHPH